MHSQAKLTSGSCGLRATQALAGWILRWTPGPAHMQYGSILCHEVKSNRPARGGSAAHSWLADGAEVAACISPENVADGPALFLVPMPVLSGPAGVRAAV